MCELLGMSANVPTDICFSFAGLIRRGGQTAQHADGWGIAFYEGKGCQAFHDPAPSARSEVARFVRGYPIRSRVVVSHIRRANRGRVGLENTHPFTRELWGRAWTFAHNGQLRGVKRWPLGPYRPVGTTDSEHAFCWLLEQLRTRWDRRPSDASLRREVGRLAARLAERGVFNMLLTDGHSLFCFCGSKLAWITRRAPFGPATLVDEDLTADFSTLTTPDDVVSVVATRPLTRDETWTVMTPGSLVTFQDGLPQAEARHRPSDKAGMSGKLRPGRRRDGGPRRSGQPGSADAPVTASAGSPRRTARCRTGPQCPARPRAARQRRRPPHPDVAMERVGCGNWAFEGIRVPIPAPSCLHGKGSHKPELQPAERLWPLIDKPVVNRRFVTLADPAKSQAICAGRRRCRALPPP